MKWNERKWIRKWKGIKENEKENEKTEKGMNQKIKRLKGNE